MHSQITELRRKISRIASVVVRGKVHATEGNKAQVTYQGDSTREGVPIVTPYGFVSIPPKGSDCVAIGSDDSVIVAIEDEKPGVNLGDSAIYSGDASVRASNGKLAIEANGDELLSLLTEVLDAVSNARTEDGKGLLEPTKQKLDALKGKIEGMMA